MIVECKCNEDGIAVAEMEALGTGERYSLSNTPEKQTSAAPHTEIQSKKAVTATQNHVQWRPYNVKCTVHKYQTLMHRFNL